MHDHILRHPTQLRAGNQNSISDHTLICAGCYFLRWDSDYHLALYGIALGSLKDGKVRSICFAEGIQPWRVHSPVRTMTHLLSVEQFTLARKLGWPSVGMSMYRVLTLPPN